MKYKLNFKEFNEGDKAIELPDGATIIGSQFLDRWVPSEMRRINTLHILYLTKADKE